MTVALGFKVHIGWTAVVALGGSPEAPEVLAKDRVDVAFTFEEGAVFHAGQELPLAKARALAEASEKRFGKLAREGLAAFTGRLGARVVAAGMAAPPPKKLPELETILKAHPMVHAAEGELYRRVFAEAAASVGPAPLRVPAPELARRVGQAVGLTPAKVTARLAAMGKASGRPWAADQKEATLAAWLALVSRNRRV